MSESPIKRSGTATADVAIASDEAAACWTTNITLTNEQFERYMVGLFASESLVAKLLKVAETRRNWLIKSTGYEQDRVLRSGILNDLCEILREAIKEPKL